MKIYILIVSLILIGCSKANEYNLVIAKNQDSGESSRQEKIARYFIPITSNMNDIDIADNSTRLTFSFAVADSNLMENYKNLLTKKLKEYGAIELIDNGKGAKIYCLDESETLEIHKPRTKTNYTYDMNDPMENKGFFKLVQLDDQWNFRIFKYRNGYPECANKFS